MPTAWAPSQELRTAVYICTLNLGTGQIFLFVGLYAVWYRILQFPRKRFLLLSRYMDKLFLTNPVSTNVVYIKLDRDADTVHGSFYFCLNHLKLKLWTVCCVYFRLVIYREITDFCYKSCASSVSDNPPTSVLFLELVKPVLLFVSGKWRI